MPDILPIGLAYNCLLAVAAYFLYRITLRLFNRFNGYTVPCFIRECRENNDHLSIAIVLAAQSLSAALLFGLVIS